MMTNLKLKVAFGVLVAAVSLQASAMRYQIKKLNSPTITINGEQLGVNDWFDDQAVITWSADNQAMRVLSEDNKVYTLSAKRYKDSNSKKFGDFIAYMRPLATRGDAKFYIADELQERFSTRTVMFDIVNIDVSDLDLSEKMCFVIESTEGSLPEGQLKVHPIKGNVSLRRSDVLSSEILEPVIVELKVGYISDDGTLKPISDKLELVVMPEDIKK